ncbi:MAG: hypothetical protein ACXVCP_20330 [Bdellovibrio sp.]
MFEQIQNKFIFTLAVLGFTASACTSVNHKDETKASGEAQYSTNRVPADQDSKSMTENELMEALVDKDLLFDYSCQKNEQTSKDEVVVHFPNGQVFTGTTFNFGQAIKEAKNKIITDGKSGVITSGNYQFVKKNFGMYLLLNNREFAYVYDLRRGLYDTCRHLDSNTGMEDVVTNFNILSLVGPFLSIQEVGTGYGTGAAHPYAYQTHHALDARTLISGSNKNTEVVSQNANLLDLVTMESLIKALQNDSYLIKNLGKEKLARAKTLPAIIKVMSGLESCEIHIPSKVEEAVSQFSVFDYREQKDQVTIRLGFSYGCEAARGNYTQLGLIVKPTDMFRQYLKQELQTAKQQNRQPYFGRYIKN